jgi:hypothetical protein
MADWRSIRDLDSALDRLIKAAPRRQREYGGLPFSMQGSTREQIARHSAALAREIPDEIAKLYQRIGGSSFELTPIDDCHVFLWPLQETRWIDNANDSLIKWSLERGYPDWYAAHFFLFGQGIHGDMLVYCPDPPHRTPGSILILDHEYRGPQRNEQQPELVVFLADSLAQWIARWTECGFEEYACSGGTDRLPPKLARRVCDDHARLNPGIDPIDPP